MDLELKGRITTATEDVYKIELTRGQKGTYGWTITVHSIQADIALDDLQHIDAALREEYLPLTSAPEEARPKEES